MTGAGRRVRAGWAEVLGIARVGSTVYVLAPRRPPHPPWMEIDAPSVGRDADELASELRERSERAGYREARIERALLAPTELLSRVIARDDVAGAVEVPVTFAAPVARHEAWFAMLGAAAGLGIGVMVWLAIGVERAGELASYPIIALAIAGLMLGVKLSRAIGPGRVERPRVMVLAPDGIVASLDGKVRALRWDRIERIDRAVEADRAGDVEDRVRVITKKGKTHRIDVRWLDAPIELVVAVGEAYRKRWSPACVRARALERGVEAGET